MTQASMFKVAIILCCEHNLLKFYSRDARQRPKYEHFSLWSTHVFGGERKSEEISRFCLPAHTLFTKTCSAKNCFTPKQVNQMVSSLKGFFCARTFTKLPRIHMSFEPHVCRSPQNDSWQTNLSCGLQCRKKRQKHTTEKTSNTFSGGRCCAEKPSILIEGKTCFEHWDDSDEI